MTTELNWVYQELGIKRKNVRWSTGGRNEEGKIYLNFWHHLFQSYDEYAYKRRDQTESAGFKEMRELIKDALANHNGIVGCIMVVAEDKDASPRKVKKAYPSGECRITSFDEAADAFTAVRVR